MRAMKEIALPESGLQELRNHRNVIWIGAVSFEERCTGSLEALGAAGMHLDKGILIEYPTRATPSRSDAKKRSAHRNMMTTYLDALGSESVSAHLHPYRLAAFNHLISGFSKETVIIADISCLTKAHVIALAFSAIRILRGNSGRILVCYTRPTEYGNGYGSPGTYKMKHGRWPDVVCAPCGFEPDLISEESNGIILLGHEASRIALSLKELAPREALLILASTPGKEYLQLVTRTVNAQLLREARARGWSIEEVRFFDTTKLQEIIRPFAAKSAMQNRRMVLYPFGPKSLVFAAAFNALDCRDLRVWYSYPVPKLYDVDYSHGVGDTRWFIVE